MSEGKRREVRQIAEMAGDAREPRRQRDAQGGWQGRACAQRGEVLADGRAGATAELDFTPCGPIARFAEHGERFAEVAHVHNGEPAGGVSRD